MNIEKVVAPLLLPNAKRRLADEYDAAQKRGDIAKRGGERSGLEHSTPPPISD
ncbi:hypothetical protein [Rhizobium leguminosarum]